MSAALELAQTRREEAIAFFQVNQTGRNAVERVVALFFSVAAFERLIRLGLSKASSRPQ